MWILFAFGSALFAGLTSILAKCGIRKTDSDTATAIRTIVVLLFSWLMVAIVGSAPTITGLSAKTWVFLILSGLATGASWLCYFRALQLGDVNKVVPIDKSSTILTIVLAFLFLGEGTTWLKGAAVVLIAIGTFLMIEKKAVTGNKAERKSWLVYAILSAVFASLTSILGKVGIDDICQKVFISHIGSPCQGTACPLLLIILYNTLFCGFLQVRSCTEHGGNPLKASPGRGKPLAENG